MLTLSVLSMLLGMFILIWAGTVTDSQQTWLDWWNGEAKLAVTFSVITGFLAVLFVMQQWTLYSWYGEDDSDQQQCS